MTQNICHDCARARKLLPEQAGPRFTDTEYQLDKYIKHTAPIDGYNYNSVFKHDSTADYSNYIINTLAAGYVEVDDRNRTNVVYFASATAGYAISMGHVEGPVYGVKVVLPHDPNKVHAFPIDTRDLEVEHCDICRKEILHEKG